MIPRLMKRSTLPIWRLQTSRDISTRNRDR
jgi:hypothetical protein